MDASARRYTWGTCAWTWCAAVGVNLWWVRSRSPPGPGYVILRQAEHYLDPGRRLNLARKFVEGALANILQRTGG